MSKSKNNWEDNLVIIVLIVIVIVLIYLVTVGNINLSDKLDAENKASEKAKERANSHETRLSKMKGIEKRLKFRFRLIHFLVRIILISLWAGLVWLFYLVGLIINATDVFVYSQAILIGTLAIHYLFSGSTTNLKDFITNLRKLVKKRVYGKHLNISERIMIRERELEILHSQAKILAIEETKVDQKNDRTVYSPDLAVSTEEEDQFKRYGFAKRVATTINDHREPNSIIFGLYGAWGEGKSSIINFVNQELKQHPDIICLYLNPWRYRDEESLLYHFFEKISQSLNKQLRSNSDKAAAFIEKYKGVSNLFGYDVSQLSTALSDSDLEILKRRVNEFLEESSFRLVVFVDDVDRLDKDEIYTLFRIIKLTADFTNTTYVLSFDPEMVGAAIGERFGKGTAISGQNFIEKIIQVPLPIPKVQPDSIRKFCISQLNEAFANDYDIEPKEVNRFLHQFTYNILPRIKTPRLAIRYSNALAFYVPLTYGEVNTVDMMLLEALKLFYPKHYTFVKNNSEYFIGSYESRDAYSTNKDEKKDRITKHLKRLNHGLSEHEISSVRELLIELFPVLDSVFSNVVYGGKQYTNWRNEKRVASASYFERFFSYTILDGDLSDIKFDEFIDSIDNNDVESIGHSITLLIAASSEQTFLFKVEQKIEELDWSIAVKLIEGVISISDSLDIEGTPQNLGFDSGIKQVSMAIYRLFSLDKHKGHDKLTVAKTYVKNASVELANEIVYWLDKGVGESDKLFSTEQIDSLNNIILEKVVAEDGWLWHNHRSECHVILRLWEKVNENAMKEYVNSFISESPENTLTFLESYLPKTRTLGSKDFQKADLSKDNYASLIKYAEPNKVKEELEKLYTAEKLSEEEVYWSERDWKANTSINAARQFLHWHEEEG